MSSGEHQLLIIGLFKTLCYRSTSDILGVAQKKEHSLTSLKLKENPLILIAEAPEKPGNIGALARTVDAAKVDALIIANSKISDVVFLRYHIKPSST